MSRQRDLPFAVRLFDPRANWLSVELRLGGHVERFHASGVVEEDPLTGLIRFGQLAAAERDDEDAMYFWTEPGGYWLSAVTGGSAVRVELTYTATMHPGSGRPMNEHAAASRVGACELGRFDFATAIWRALRRAEAEIVSVQSSSAWGHVYPERDVTVLGAALKEPVAVHEP